MLPKGSVVQCCSTMPIDVGGDEQYRFGALFVLGTMEQGEMSCSVENVAASDFCR